jgi:AraC-like DNA-binding protein/quercetin dioxygenase-like cupin family protein
MDFKIAFGIKNNRNRQLFKRMATGKADSQHESGRSKLFVIFRSMISNNQIDTKNKLEKGTKFKISRFKEQIKRTKPHKHDDYYELILLSAGEGFHSIETEKFVVSPPECYFLRPGQLHFWEFTSIPKGFAVLFKEEEFDDLRESELTTMYRKLAGSSRFGIPSADFPEPILNELVYEYQRNTAYSHQIIHGLLAALFGKLLAFSDSHLPRQNTVPAIFERFRQLLPEETPRLHKVREFASLLNTSPQNLNTICRKQANCSASELISAQLLLEAKRYILHTDNTIAEIAELLSFSDASNFVKFFKKAEGKTPVQFRKQYFQ